MTEGTCQGPRRVSGALAAFKSIILPDIILIQNHLFNWLSQHGMVALRIRTGGSKKPGIIKKKNMKKPASPKDCDFNMMRNAEIYGRKNVYRQLFG